MAFSIYTVLYTYSNEEGSIPAARVLYSVKHSFAGAGSPLGVQVPVCIRGPKYNFFFFQKVTTSCHNQMAMKIFNMFAKKARPI